jgi:hypothetical protein
MAVCRDAVGRLLALGSGGMGSVLGAQSRAVEEMLLLARGVLCADLLAVDALDGETLFWMSCLVSWWCLYYRKRQDMTLPCRLP